MTLILAAPIYLQLNNEAAEVLYNEIPSFIHYDIDCYFCRFSLYINNTSLLCGMWIVNIFSYPSVFGLYYSSPLKHKCFYVSRGLSAVEYVGHILSLC